MLEKWSQEIVLDRRYMPSGELEISVGHRTCSFAANGSRCWFDPRPFVPVRARLPARLPASCRTPLFAGEKYFGTKKLTDGYLLPLNDELHERSWVRGATMLWRIFRLSGWWALWSSTTACWRCCTAWWTLTTFSPSCGKRLTPEKKTRELVLLLDFFVGSCPGSGGDFCREPCRLVLATFHMFSAASKMIASSSSSPSSVFSPHHGSWSLPLSQLLFLSSLGKMCVRVFSSNALIIIRARPFPLRLTVCDLWTLRRDEPKFRISVRYLRCWC